MFIIIINAGAGDVDDTCDRVWATLFHCMSTNDDPNHQRRCPSGEESWCFYKRAERGVSFTCRTCEKEPPSDAVYVKQPLAFDVAAATVPIYERMSDPNLLKRMLKGKTQNSNECLHSVIWNRCPKTGQTSWMPAAAQLPAGMPVSQCRRLCSVPIWLR